MVWLDEAGVAASICRERGWSVRGQRLRGQRQGRRSGRINLIGALRDGEIIAPLRFQGSCNTALFLRWIREILVHELTPGQTVVMDNASYHKALAIREAIAKAGCRVLFLPPYSPDLNPIEGWWSAIKARIRAARRNFMQLAETIDDVFQPFVMETS